MRSLLLLAALPLMASGHHALKIQEARVTWGAGVEPKGPMPPARFMARVVVEGQKWPQRAQFRAWCVKVGDLKALEQGVSLRKLLGDQGGLEATATPGAGGSWTLQGPWPHPPEAQDRLVVEVWFGRRRLGWAVAPLVEQALPVTRPTQAPPQD